MIIRDAVHGDIEITDIEREIMDTAEVQRLRWVKQLGATCYVYPSAMHTRFEHSLGTIFCAQKIIQCIQKQNKIDDELVQIIRLAALLHDVTHIPFGHTFEDERKLMDRHDKGDRFTKMTDGTELGKALKKFGFLEKISAMVDGKKHKDIPLWAKQIVSSTVDADLLDYLKRDNYFTGLSQSYDDRILQSFMLHNDELGLNMVKKGLDRQDTLTEIMNLLRLRYFLTERVYFHHTKITAGAMISKALEYCFPDKITEDDLIKYGDGSFFASLTKKSKESRKLIKAVQERKLFKRAFVITYQNSAPEVPELLVKKFAHNRKNRAKTEEAIAKKAGISPEEIILYCTTLPSNKEAEVKVNSTLGWVAFNDMSSLKTFQELALLNNKFKHLWKMYIFCPPEHVVSVAKASAQVFDLKNELAHSDT